MDPPISDKTKKKLADLAQNSKNKKVSRYREAKLMELTLWHAINSGRHSYVSDNKGKTESELKEMFEKDASVKAAVTERDEHRIVADGLVDFVKSCMSAEEFMQLLLEINNEASEEALDLPGLMG